jgi:hypothetical protein
VQHALDAADELPPGFTDSQGKLAEEAAEAARQFVREEGEGGGRRGKQG